MMDGLEPAGLWRNFQAISRIPRDSKKEAQACAYVIQRAQALGLAYRTDAAGNVLVIKPGVSGAETVILQAHLDMVCEKNQDTVHDFDTDPITLVSDGEWVRADGTTLGADNGIGVAAMLAIMEDTTLTHPPLELLFTIDEETGLTGAEMLERGFVTGRTLLNLDSEDDRTLIVGCAGGKDTELDLDLSYEDAPSGHIPLRLRVHGLRGGHSGTDIHTGRGNAIKLLTRCLLNAGVDFRLASIAGGNKRNAIPREASAVITIDPADRDALQTAVSRCNAIFAAELAGIDDDVRLTLQDAALADNRVIASRQGRMILDLLNALPHGVIVVDMERAAVVTSTNLAVCAISDKVLRIATSHRSPHATARDMVARQVESIGALAGVRVVVKHAYPGWKPDFNSHVLAVARQVYRARFGTDPRVEVIHAGLECGVIGDKIPGLDMISFGPTIEQAHSPSEKVSVPSVARFWVFLLDILAQLARN